MNADHLTQEIVYMKVSIISYIKFVFVLLNFKSYLETVTCSQLLVNFSNVWEYFLDNEQQFNWNVVRLKVI